MMLRVFGILHRQPVRTIATLGAAVCVLCSSTFGIAVGPARAAEVAQPATPAVSSNTSDSTPEQTRESVPSVRVNQLEWSKNPGVYEADLRRRFGNPLYFEARQRIGEQELLSAKSKDAEKMWAVLENFIDLLSDKNRMAKFELASQMGDALLRIDEATWKALRVGGEAYGLAAAIQRLRSELLERWQVSSAADPGVKALLDAESRIATVRTESSVIRFLALIQAGDGGADNSPIRRHEYAQALMNEDAKSIKKIYGTLRGQLKVTMREQLTLLLKEIARDQIEFEGRDQKVVVVTGMLGINPSDLGLRVRQ
jgi:hypothetical protein